MITTTRMMQSVKKLLETYERHQIFEMIDLLRNSLVHQNALKVHWETQPWTGEYVMHVEIHTGGLSQNETLVESFLKNPNTHLVYQMWKCGGHHYFEIPPSIARYELISEFCKKNNRTRQSVHAFKHKYYWLYSDNKSKNFIRLKESNDGK